MRVQGFAAAVALVCSSFATPALAALQPTTNWAVDYGDTQCAAARSFGPADDPITFAIVPSINGEMYRLIVNRKRQGPVYAEEASGSIHFGDTRINTWLLHFGQRGVNSSNFEFHVSAAQLQKARSAAAIGFRSDNGQDFEFALSEMPALLDALAKCTADLQQYWNYGQRTTLSDSKTPRGDLRSLFRADDYPSEALSRMQSGTSQYQLLVNEKGEVTGCDLIVQSGVPVIDSMGCQVMRERAKFKPSIDTTGKAVRSVVTTPPIVWRVM
jgi:hypothetical protein